MIDYAFAMGAPGGGTGSGGSSFLAFLPMIVIFAILYFLMIRPQMKKQKDQQNMLSSLKAGDKVITTGGIHGSISSINEGIIMLKIANNVTVEINKTSVSKKR